MEGIKASLAGLPYRERESKPREKGARGNLTRVGETEWFSYKLEGSSLKDLKYFLVKGNPEHCRDCKRLEADPSASEQAAAVGTRESEADVPCYFVIENFLMDEQRFIRLFINAEDASEQNLLALLKHFSRQHSEPEPLAIRVYTDLKQEYSLGGPPRSDYFTVMLFRNSYNEVIRYQRPHEKIVTQVVKGADLFPDLDDQRGTEGYRVH